MLKSMADNISVMAVKLTISALLYIILLGQLQNTEGCRTGDLRTIPGNPDDGKRYPLYCHNGQWRRLCDGGGGAGSWLDSSARVACRQLGYCGFIARGYNCPDGQLTVTTPITMTVRLAVPTCTGTESRIQDCGIVETSCQCGSLAWLTCQSACTDGEIRLVERSTNNQGRVEVCVDGRWGTVCNNNQQLAPAVCSQLGFVSEGVLTIISTSPTIPQPINSCTIQSGGSLSCSLITDTSCDHSMDLGVVCRTHQQLYNELLDQLSSTTDPPSNYSISENPTPCPVMTCPRNEGSTCSLEDQASNSSQIIAGHNMTVILGVISCVLLVLLIGTVIALVIMCWKRNQAKGSPITQSDKNMSTDYSNNPAYGVVQHDQTTCETETNPAYEVVKRDQKRRVTL